VRVYVEGIGVRGPGLDGWAASRAVLVGADPYLPAPASLPANALLPANERRRTVQTVKLTLAVGAEAFAAARRDAATTATVFSSSGGDGETIHEILKALATGDHELSPTRFHNSVHNAPAGYWSIATKSQAPSSSLCCHDASFAAGLVEAAVQATVDDRAVALIAYDLPYPEPLNSVRHIGAVFGVALVLAPAATENCLAQLDIKITPQPGTATPMTNPALEAVRQGTPAARSLPLLAAIARNTPLTLGLDYVPGLRIDLSLAGAATLAGVDGEREAHRAAPW
jgi:beta-ketoacyl synthase-like protein